MVDAMPVMKCGHTAQAHVGGDPTKPACVICSCTERVMEHEKPDLTGRRSKCSSSHKRIDEDGYGYNYSRINRRDLKGAYPVVTDSSYSLPFFEHCPDKPFDRHYCGCSGWG